MKKFSKIITKKDCLYRYRRCNEDSLEALKEGRVYFSVPKDFNDPYDCLIFANTKSVGMGIMGNAIIGKMDNVTDSRSMEIALRKRMHTIITSNNPQDTSVRNGMEMIFSALDSIRGNLKRNPRIICFSEDYSSMLMWSHYADYHKGFVIVYGKDDLTNAKRFDINNQEIKEKTRLEPVKYVDEQLDMTEEITEYVRYNMLNDTRGNKQVDITLSAKAVRTVITEKAKEWSYEKEWRLIPNNPKIEKASKLSYIRCRALAVILGSKCQGEDREKLIEVCESRGIPAYGIYLSEVNPEFKLSVNDEGSLEIATPKYAFLPR